MDQRCNKYGITGRYNTGTWLRSFILYPLFRRSLFASVFFPTVPIELFIN